MERLKSESSKKEKGLNAANKKVEQLSGVQVEHERALRLTESLQRENRMLVEEGEAARDSLLQEKGRLLRETDQCNRQLIEVKQEIEQIKAENHQLRVRAEAAEDRAKKYE